MEHPCVIQPAQHAAWRADRMGKVTICESSRLAARDAHEASCEAKVKGFGRRVVQAAVWAKYRFISPHK